MPGAVNSHATTVVDAAASQKDRHHRSPKAVVIHQAPDPMPKLDDFVLFPKESVEIEKFSTVKSLRRAKRENIEEVRQRNSLRCMDQSKHLIGSVASSEHDREGRNGSYLVEAKCKEPPAPTFTRLPTPDFVDDDGLDFWSCCASTQSSFTEESNRNNTEDFEERYVH